MRKQLIALLIITFSISGIPVADLNIANAIVLSGSVSGATDSINNLDSQIDDLYKQGEILIKFKSGQNPTALFLTKYNLSSPEKIIKTDFYQNIASDIKSIGLDRWYKVKLNNVLADPLTVAQAIVADSRVEYAEPNYIFKVQSTPEQMSWGLATSPYQGLVTQQSYEAGINAPGAWAINGIGDEFGVAIIDTGIDYYHEDLVGRVWGGCNFITGGAGNCGNYMDDDGHGTHIAGVIGAAHNGVGIMGVTNGARIAALKACNSSGLCEADNVVEAIIYAIANNFRVINASFGAHINQENLPVAVVLEGILAANNNGVLFIASAGNSGPNLNPMIGGEMNNDLNPFYPASYPLPNIVAVTNTDRWDNRSGNFGTLSVDLGAPGVTIRSTLPNNGYGDRSGSSVATAFTSGAIALYWSYNQDIDHLTIKDRLLQRTDKIVSMTGTSMSGGRLNVCNLFGDTLCSSSVVPIPNL